ncbi:MAG: hypothetical protein J3R72DRAFT_106529 [Linnemannia gamsii]|nr:MAG: hypothetical protein J3R72DRAFT_106529 [Linnemannia gamsii]
MFDYCPFVRSFVRSFSSPLLHFCSFFFSFFSFYHLLPPTEQQQTMHLEKRAKNIERQQCTQRHRKVRGHLLNKEHERKEKVLMDAHVIVCSPVVVFFTPFPILEEGRRN